MRRIWSWLKVRYDEKMREVVETSQVGQFSVSVVVSLIVGVLVIGTVVAALWSALAATDTSIQALTETDAGTVMLKAMWPIVLVCVGIGIAAGAVIWVLKKAGVMD